MTIFIGLYDCEDMRCMNACPHGRVRDEYDCETCTCADEPVPDTCPPVRYGQHIVSVK